MFELALLRPQNYNEGGVCEPTLSYFRVHFDIRFILCGSCREDNAARHISSSKRMIAESISICRTEIRCRGNRSPQE